MRLGIDASNITSGGGLTHLVAFLQDAEQGQRYESIVLWSSSATIDQLPEPAANVEYRTNGSCGHHDSSPMRRQTWMCFSCRAGCISAVSGRS